MQVLLAYIEHLVHLSLAYPTICNHVSALKHMFNRFQWPSSIFSDPLVSQLLHSIDVNVPRPLSNPTILSIADLTALIQATFTHPLGFFLRPLFLLAFFGFFRISNLLPKSSVHSPSLGRVVLGYLMFRCLFSTTPFCARLGLFHSYWPLCLCP